MGLQLVEGLALHAKVIVLYQVAKTQILGIAWVVQIREATSPQNKVPIGLKSFSIWE